MRQGTIRRAILLDASLTVVLLLSLAGPAAQAPPPSPAPPSGGVEAAPPAETTPPAEPAPPPRIIRVVCTDHICGHCDGKCHKESGHVAVDKKGHCACTPTEGSPLDTAIRQAHAKNPPK